MMLALAVFSSVGWACPDLDESVDSAVGHALSADVGATERDLLGAEEALGCAPVTASQAARYFIVRGGAAEFLEPGSGDRLFASARALDPSVWEERLGPDLKAKWAVASVEGVGSLTLDTNHDGGWIDGVHVDEWPGRRSAGWHVVQVISLDGSVVLYGKSVNLPAGEDALVQTGLAESAASTTQAPPTVKRRVVSPAWLIASGVVAAAGGGLAAGATLQAHRMPDYGSEASIDSAWNREQQFAYSAYAAWGVAGVLCGLSFVLP